MSDLLLDPSLVNEEELILKAETLLAEAGKNLVKQNAAIDEVVNMLMELPDEGTRELYVTTLAKKFKITKKTFLGKLKAAQKSAPGAGNTPQDLMDLPPEVDANEAYKRGYFISKNAYYFITKDGIFKASNFVMDPVLHIYSKTDNKRIIEVRNEYGERKTLDLPSKNLVSTDQFQASIYAEGNFLFYGTKLHHLRILTSVSRDFPVANELRTLGWQREGFWAFSNGIYNSTWQPVDEFGVTVHNNVKYFSPAFSKIYADVREDDDEYENDRFFIYKPSPVGFGQWAQLMLDVYGPNGRWAVAFFIAALMRDFIYDKFKSFPHLFLFGEKQSGKSQMAWSLSNMFFDELPAFNLNSGTHVGFFRRLGRVKNAICWFDEYTNDIDERRFQALKSSYDGMGHEKGRMSRDNRTDVTKVNSASVISGQYLPTRDDNALFTRSIMLTFEKQTYSAEHIKKYDRLKELESKGMQSLVTEVLKHRDVFIRDYTKTFSAEFDNVKNTMDERKLNYTERIARNYTYALASLKVFCDNQLLGIPFTYDDFLNEAISQIDEQTTQVSNSEGVSTFWLMIQYMLDARPAMISRGEDFKFETKTGSLKLRDKRDVWTTVTFEHPAKLIYFRFSKIHPLYMEAHRKQYGRNGIDMVSLMHYIKYHKAFVGYTDSTRFDNMVTSAWIFDYEKLAVNLEREVQLGDSDQGLPY